MMDDQNDPDDVSWCQTQRNVVFDYLQSEGVEHGRVGDWPAWHVTGCVAIWAIESVAHPDWIGWWVVSGDLPTDYCSAADIQPPQHPRKAARLFGTRWLTHANSWLNKQDTPEFKISGSTPKEVLAPLLIARGKLLLDFSDDDSLWED